MKKYAFLVYHKEYLKFLEGLQSLGVLHVIEKESGEIDDEGLREQYAHVNDLNHAIKFLSKRESAEAPVSDADGLTILNELKALWTEQETYAQKLATIEKEISQLEPWGNFKWESIHKLKEVGIAVKFYSCSARQFKEEWNETYHIAQINDVSGQLYFAVFHKEDESVELDAEEMRLPDHSLKQLLESKDEIAEITARTEEIYDTFAGKYTQLLTDTKNDIEGKLDFDKVVLNTQKEAEEKIMLLEGWVPEDKEAAIDSYTEENGIFVEKSEPVVEEPVPIKLKNNKFAKLFESIGELYTFPDYKELDLTPFFAPFFMLFFGFCLGDAGYGLLILIATIILRGKVKPQLKPMMTLGMFLGIATIVMGLISGTIFGIMLLESEIPWVEQYKKFMLDSDKLMLLAVGLGFVQIVFGMFLKAFNKIRMYGFMHGVSTFGWIILIVGGATLLFLKQTDSIAPDSLKKAMIALFIVAGIPIFFLNTPGKNPFLNFGLGIWDTYGMASGLLGDLLSYIRLFALGISSAVLGSVFNQLAMDLSPDTIVVRQIVMILILLFGHSLNLFMAALGSFVHPLRLTFVEFYKNAGFLGGGKKYQPFENK